MNMHSRKRRFALVAIICLLALVIRSVGLTTQSATMDEAVELEIAAMPISGIVHEANSFPPLYHLLLKSWLGVFDGLFAARAFSVLLGVASIVVLYAMAADFANHRTGLFCIAIASISPLHVFYSQEARSYMLYFFLASVTLWTGLRMGRSYSKQSLAAFVAAAVFGAYVHYYFVLILVAIAAVSIFFYGPNRFGRFLVAAILIGVLSLPTVFLLNNDLDFQANLRPPRPLNLVSIGYTFFSFASGYSLGPSRSSLHVISTTEAIRESIPWAVAITFAYGLPFLIGCWRLQRKLLVWLGLLVFPLACMFLLCVGLGLTYNPRFAVWLWIPFALICSAGIESLSVTKATIFLLSIVLLSTTALANRHLDERYQNEDMDSVVSFLQSQPHHPTLICSGYMSRVFRLLADPSQQAVPLFDASHSAGSEERAITQIQEFLNGGCWFVYSRGFHGDPRGEILEFVKSQRAEHDYHAAGVDVYRIPRSAAGNQ